MKQLEDLEKLLTQVLNNSQVIIKEAKKQGLDDDFTNGVIDKFNTNTAEWAELLKKAQNER